jgi:hypothetical protein
MQGLQYGITRSRKGSQESASLPIVNGGIGAPATLATTARPSDLAKEVRKEASQGALMPNDEPAHERYDLPGLSAMKCA